MGTAGVCATRDSACASRPESSEPAFRGGRFAFRGGRAQPKSAFSGMRRAPSAPNPGRPPCEASRPPFGVNRPPRKASVSFASQTVRFPERSETLGRQGSGMRRRSISATPVSWGAAAGLFDKRWALEAGRGGPDPERSYLQGGPDQRQHPLRLGLPLHLVAHPDLPAVEHLGAGATSPVGLEEFLETGAGLLHPFAGGAFHEDAQAGGPDPQGSPAGLFEVDAGEQEVPPAGGGIE